MMDYKYLYLSHEGGIYLLDEYEEPQRCETCGDCDEYIGVVTSMEDVALRLFDEYGCSEDFIESVTGYRVVFEKVREVEF